MPPKKCLDPEVLAAKRKHRREMGRIRMAKHRAKGKELVTEMLGTALATVCNGPDVITGEHQSLAERTAQAILKRTLRRHGVTQDKIVSVVAQALDAVKVKTIGEETTSLPDWQSRLRAGADGWKILEFAGEVPIDRGPSPGRITVNVLVMADDNTERMRTVEAQAREPDTDTPIE